MGCHEMEEGEQWQEQVVGTLSDIDEKVRSFEMNLASGDWEGRALVGTHNEQAGMEKQ